MASSKPVPLSTVLKEIATLDQVCVRMAMTRKPEGQLEVRSLLVNVLPQVWLDNIDAILSDWLGEPIRFEYPHAVFLSRRMDSKDVRGWFGNGEHRVEGFDWRLGQKSRGLAFEMPTLGPQALGARLPSYT